ncbi:MAG: hypothetical protein LC792_16700 [Actinobacteria bacterium]|nr:hypothetical protein [Actinomycetota bacterium]
MSIAFSAEWCEEQAKLCLEDEEFQTGIAKFNRKVLVLIHPSPEHGVTEERVYGFDFPTMAYLERDGDEWVTDYILEGNYADWYKVNEGIDDLVPALMNEQILVPKGSVSYVARFLPAIQRYMSLARTHTTGYEGTFISGDPEPPGERDLTSA